MPNLGFVDQVADQVAANPGAGMQPPGPAGPPPVILQFMQGLSQILPGLPPEKAQAIGQLLIATLGQQESAEPEPGHPPMGV